MHVPPVEVDRRYTAAQEEAPVGQTTGVRTDVGVRDVGVVEWRPRIPFILADGEGQLAWLTLSGELPYAAVVRLIPRGLAASDAFGRVRQVDHSRSAAGLEASSQMSAMIWLVAT